LNAEQLERLARCFDEEVIAARSFGSGHCQVRAVLTS
jgi:hypothetical protein